MNKLLLVAVVIIYFLSLGIVYYKNISDDYKKTNIIYNANNKLLMTKIKEVYDDKLETDKRIKELQEEAKKDKTFNWNIDISSSPVIKRLQAN